MPAALRIRSDEIDVRVLGCTLPIRVWSPAAGELPLLIVHDGPEYDARAKLARYARGLMARGAVEPFRVALLPPGRRDEWYSASASYGRSLCRRIIPAIADQLGVAGKPVGMGASLGALAMLQAQRAWPGTRQSFKLIERRINSPAGTRQVCCQPVQCLRTNGDLTTLCLVAQDRASAGFTKSA